MIVKRTGAIVAVMVLAVLGVLGVVPGTSLSAAAISDDYDQTWFEYQFQDFWGENGSNAMTALDKVNNFLYGPDAACVATGREDGLEFDCEEVMRGLVAPTGATSGLMFTQRAAANGVRIASGSGTNAVTAGLIADVSQISPGTVTVDTDVTDLALAEGSPPGWAGGINTFSDGSTAHVVTDAAYGDYGGSIAISRVYNGSSNLSGSTAFGCIRLGGAAGTDCGLGFSTRPPGYTINQWVGVHGVIQPNVYMGVSYGLDYVRVGRSVGAGVWEYLYWYPVGHVDRPPDDLGGLVGTMESTYVCRDATGTTSNYYASVEVAGGLGEVPVQLDGFSCAANEMLISALVEWVTDEGVDVVFDYSAPAWVQDTPPEWQLCGDMNCELRLFHGTEYCGENAIGCPDWWTVDRDEYTCKFGPYDVAIDYCSALRKPGEVTPTGRVSVDEDGQLQYEGPLGKPDAWYSEIDYELDELDPLPDPDEPDLPIPPGDGDFTSPPSKCWPTGWSVFNPFQWVYRPVTCALSWAFVPAAGVTFAATNGAFDDSSVGQIGDSLVQIGEAFTFEGLECRPLVSHEVGVAGGEPLEISLCQYVGPVVSQFRSVLGIAVILFASVATLYMVIRALGFHVVGGNSVEPTYH